MLVVKNIFIAGSITIKKLDPAVQARINNMIDSGLTVLLGDANGVDSAVQAYLHARQYQQVRVYCSGERPRYNLGAWSIAPVETTFRAGSREYFTAKDIAMAQAADYGFMIWDQTSTGTLSNVLELLAQGKKSVISLAQQHAFLTVASVADCEKFLSFMDAEAIAKANQKINLSQKIHALRAKQEPLF
ncbi:MAG: hypothetical protein HYZ45_04710 [Burkholderiales bacterium]|nr:hypothetical protein [Burkholderiales bacterium]